MDFPSDNIPNPPILTTAHVQSMGLVGATASAWAGIYTASSLAWTNTNKAFYYPFRLTSFGIAKKLLWWVGATSSGNIDVGIYDAALNRVVSIGPTAMSATVNTVQELDITDTTLPPGDYYLGALCSNSTGTCFVALSNSDESDLPSLPIYEEAVGSGTLPAVATPVVSTLGTVPVFIVGIQFASAF